MYIQHLIAVCFGLCALADSALSQTAPRPSVAGNGPDETWSIPDRNRINEGTVTVITAPAGGATSVFGSDMARVLDDDATVRVLPVLGKGPVRNVVDVLYLKSIDMGIVTTDVPEFYKLQYKIPDITSKLRYIAKLYHNELHVIARTSIKSIFDLEGKKIVAPTDVGYYAGKVFQLARNLIKNEDRALHLVPIPFDRRLWDFYLPTTLSGEDYPNLLSPGETI